MPVIANSTWNHAPNCLADPAKPNLVYRTNDASRPELWPEEYTSASEWPTPEQCCDWCRKSWDCAYWVHYSYSSVSGLVDCHMQQLVASRKGRCPEIGALLGALQLLKREWDWGWAGLVHGQMQ